MLKSLVRMALYVLFLIVCGWALSRFYASLQALGHPPWLTIAFFHSILAVFIFLRPAPFSHTQSSRWRSVGLSLIPGLALGAGCLLLVFLGLLIAGPSPPLSQPQIPVWPSLATILWVPCVEEVVFRRGLGGILRQKAGPWLGMYGSSLIFSLAHGATLDGFLPLPALGPFLLGLICELIYWRSHSLWGALFFHAMCNASPLIFLSLDPRWLDWLSLLYLQG